MATKKKEKEEEMFAVGNKNYVEEREAALLPKLNILFWKIII